MKSLKQFWLIWIGILTLILITSQLIVTDSKRVHRILRSCEESIRSADATGLLSHIAPDYSYQGLDWATFDMLTRMVFQKNQFAKTILYNKKIQMEGDTANVRFAAFFQATEQSVIHGPLRTSWRLKLSRRNKEWLITEIELVSVENKAVGELKEAMQQAAAMSKE